MMHPDVMQPQDSFLVCNDSNINENTFTQAGQDRLIIAPRSISLVAFFETEQDFRLTFAKRFVLSDTESNRVVNTKGINYYKQQVF